MATAAKKPVKKPAAAATKAAPAPAPKAAAKPAPKAAPAPAPAPVARMPLGIYMSRERNTAIAFKHTERGVWYLTMITGHITLEHCGEDRFTHDFPLVLPGYPLLRAVRKYANSGLSFDEQCGKVLRALMRS